MTNELLLGNAEEILLDLTRFLFISCNLMHECDIVGTRKISSFENKAIKVFLAWSLLVNIHKFLLKIKKEE